MARNGLYEPGDLVGGFRIEGIVGKGGMGVVYRATHLRLDQTVALKVLAAHLRHDDEFRQRFVREARTAVKLKHPNILPVFDAGDVGDDSYISMLYVDGGDLQRLLSQGPLPPERAIEITVQVANALQAAHELGVIHRDVKPANILLEGDSKAYLSDFGIARPDTATALTNAGTFLGSVDYCSPEQLEGKQVDGRTDLYALGCVLYHCLTGKPPYERDSQVAVIKAHLLDPIPSLPPISRASEALNEVIRRAIAKNADERHTTAVELLTELQGCTPRGEEPIAFGEFKAWKSSEPRLRQSNSTSVDPPRLAVLGPKPLDVGSTERLSQAESRKVRREVSARSKRRILGISVLTIGICVAGVFGVLNRSNHEAWATWKPSSGSVSSVTSEIATHVTSRYKLNASTPLVVVLATPPQVVSGTDKILVSQAAIRKVAGSGTGIRVVTTSGFRMYQFCGIGDACAIGQGQPSETRGRLIRREALEAALYTFKYTTAKTVIAYLPPPLGSTTTMNLLFLEKSNFSKQLSQPLSKTLPLETPPLPADPDTKEAATIDALTLHALYSYTYQLLQDNSAIMILDPIR